MWSTPYFNSVFQILNLILVWSPAVVIGLIVLFAFITQLIVTWEPSSQVRRYFKFLIVAMILFRLGFAALASFLQYAVWLGSSFTQLFLPPHAPWSYFAQYVFTHYWLNALLSILAAGFLWIIFETLRRYNLGVVKREEPLVALIAALIVGWPALLVLIPTALILAVFFAIIIIAANNLGTRFPSCSNKPTFEWPLLLATPVAILFAKPILLYLGLSAIFA